MLNLIIDLDNTIYPVSSIGQKLFAPLFELLQSPEYGLPPATIKKAEVQIMRIPFQKVADQFNFPSQLKESALKLLRELKYDDQMDYFEDYPLIRDLNTKKFLLTTGFKNLQESKIRSLKIENDFTEMFIVDPDMSKLTKKDVMTQIMNKYRFRPEDLLVIGDDPESEIKAANELNIASFLFDPNHVYLQNTATYTGKSLKEVLNYIN